MKKFFITLIALCGLALQANADVTVYVESTTLVAGKAGQVNIHVKSDKDVKSCQVSIELPDGVIFTDKAVALYEDFDMFGGSPLNGGKNMNIAFLAASAPVPAGDVVIAKVPVEVDASADLKNYNIALSGLVAGFNDGTDTSIEVVPVEEGQDVITVSDKLILDENSTALPGEFEGVDVLVKRTIKANEWSTICLPFEVDPQDLADAIGGNVEVAEFIDTEVDEDGNLNVNFDNVDYIDANYPYIIKTSVDVDEFTVASVDVLADEEGAVAEFASGSGKRKLVTAQFCGVLHAGDAIPTFVEPQNGNSKQEALATVFISGGKFYWTSAATQPIKAFRGYFAFVDDVRDAGVKMVINGEATRINEVQNNVVKNGAIYDLSGKQVRNINNLKGVFIQNGKKVVK